MSDDEMIDEDELGRDLRAAVHRLERADAPPPDVRERAAARMREAYVRHVADDPSAEPAPAASELTTLLTDEPDLPERSLWLPAAAAAIVVVGIGALAWSVGSDVDPTPVDEAPTTTIEEPIDIARPLGTGTITTDVLGTPLTLTTEEPLWLLRADRGVIVLGLGEEVEETNTLTILRPGDLASGLGADDLESLLDGLSGSQEQPIAVAGRSGLSWRLLDLPGSGLCTPACRPLYAEPGRVRLPDDRIVDVIEVPVTDGLDAVLIATSDFDDFVFDRGGPFAPQIASMAFDDVTDLGEPPAGPSVEVDPSATDS